jgi:hypothetical protein
MFENPLSLIETARTLKNENKIDEALELYKKASISIQNLDILREAKSNLNDKDRFELLKIGLDFPYTSSSDWSSWLYYDELSIVAYYQKDKRTANKAYKILIEHSNFPQDQKDRILSNAQFLDSKENENYHTLCSEIKSISSKLGFNSDPGINSILHFIYIKGYDFQFHHYLSVISAYKQMTFKRIHIYYNIEPENNKWWKLVNNIPNVFIYKITIPTFINYNSVPYKQHQADIIRLVALKEMGGVYNDLDILTIKNYSDLIAKIQNNNKDIGLVFESDGRLSNAFIISTQNNKFINEWLYYYETTYGTVGDWWAGLSVEKPHELSLKYKDIIEIFDKTSFLPFDYFHTDFFTKSTTTIDYSNSYGVHLWDTEQQKRGILPKNEIEFAVGNSIFYQMFKEYIPTIHTLENLYPIFTFVEGGIHCGKNKFLDDLNKSNFSIPHLTIFDKNYYISESNSISNLFSQMINKYKIIIDSLKNKSKQLIIIENSHLPLIYCVADLYLSRKLIIQSDYDLFVNSYSQLFSGLLENIKISNMIYVKTSPEYCVPPTKENNWLYQQYILESYSLYKKWISSVSQNVIEIDGDLERDEFEFDQVAKDCVTAIENYIKKLV